jgi:hypothetical protein
LGAPPAQFPDSRTAPRGSGIRACFPGGPAPNLGESGQSAARHPGLDGPHPTITVGLWPSDPSDMPVGPSAWTGRALPQPDDAAGDRVDDEPEAYGQADPGNDQRRVWLLADAVAVLGRDLFHVQRVSEPPAGRIHGGPVDGALNAPWMRPATTAPYAQQRPSVSSSKDVLAPSGVSELVGAPHSSAAAGRRPACGQRGSRWRDAAWPISDVEHVNP